MNRKGKLYWEAFRAVFAAKMMFWNAIILPVIIVICYRKPDGLLLSIGLWVIATAVLAFFLTRSIVSVADCALELRRLTEEWQKWCLYMTTPYLLIFFVICPPAMLIYGGLGLLVAWANARQNRATE